MDLKHFTARLTSLALIASGLYQTLLSLNAIFFIYPHLTPQARETLIIQEGLIEKALILYASMVISSIYGVMLLFKPAEKLKIVHILSGAIIFVGSIFFITQTPFTVDPVQQFLIRLLETKR